jgi:hypothetical protein
MSDNAVRILCVLAGVVLMLAGCIDGLDKASAALVGAGSLLFGIAVKSEWLAKRIGGPGA